MAYKEPSRFLIYTTVKLIASNPGYFRDFIQSSGWGEFDEAVTEASLRVKRILSTINEKNPKTRISKKGTSVGVGYCNYIYKPSMKKRVEKEFRKKLLERLL